MPVIHPNRVSAPRTAQGVDLGREQDGGDARSCVQVRAGGAPRVLVSIPGGCRAVLLLVPPPGGLALKAPLKINEAAKLLLAENLFHAFLGLRRTD